MKAKNTGEGHQGEDIYNYDEPSDGEIEDDDEHHGNDSNNNTRKSSSQLIELKAAMDTDDEFHDNGRQNENGHEEGESPQTPPPRKDRSHSPPPKKHDYEDNSVKDRESKKSKHHHHKSSSKKEKSSRSKSSSVSSSSHRSPKGETIEYEKPKIYLPKKYQEDGPWKGGKNKDVDTVKEPSPEGRKRRDSSILSSNSDYDGEYFKRMASRSKDPFHDPTDKGEDDLFKHLKN